MPDRKKVMSWLEGLAQQDWRMFHSDSEVQVIAESALALLKKQEAVVRCKDCKHWERRECGSYGTCEERDGFFDADWFCADGERKEGR